MEYELVQVVQSEVHPKMEISMYFAYGNHKRQGVSSDTTFAAILNGERTATTRYESDYAKYPGTFDKLKSLKPGDIIAVRNTKKREDPHNTIYVRITKSLHKLVQN